jgi:UDP-N-acetylglucosamine 4,6-dehydratase
MTTLITGGTGSFGHAYVKAALGHGERVVVFSRDEEKQRVMLARYPDVVFAIGDVRDADSLRRVFHNERPDRVFHAAALKQVPGCEFNVLEAVRTNILGTDNVCRVAAEFGARTVVLSTDKAVEPVGVMGATKFLAEGIARNWGVNSVRYGNVVGSRGSILPIWRDQVSRGEPITITDPTMTRFLITLPQAVELVLTAFEAEPDGSTYVLKSPAATVEQLARVFLRLQPKRGKSVTVGIRPGEKLHEDLVGQGESATETDECLIVHAGGQRGLRWSSQDAPRLTDDAVAALLQQAPA